VNELLDASLIQKKEFTVNIRSFEVAQAIQEIVKIEKVSADLRRNIISVDIDLSVK
jgi:hypothetical protein